MNREMITSIMMKMVKGGDRFGLCDGEAKDSLLQWRLEQCEKYLGMKLYVSNEEICF